VALLWGSSLGGAVCDVNRTNHVASEATEAGSAIVGHGENELDTTRRRSMSCARSTRQSWSGCKLDGESGLCVSHGAEPYYDIVGRAVPVFHIVA